MATVEEIFSNSIDDLELELSSLIHSFKNNHPNSDDSLITKAYQFSIEAHNGQLRNSGEPYFIHPFSVAKIVADLGLDEMSIAAALLHDSVEDTSVKLEDIEKEFGLVVSEIVDGVTKLERLHFDSKQAQQAATMRKMLVAMAKDWRVLIIKLSDRLHNMRTLATMPLEKQQRIAQETLDIYAPLAHRLGIQEIKWQLEDLAFASLHPRWYAEIDQMVAARDPERDIYLTQVLGNVTEKLNELNIKAEVTVRPKHLWSIYEKMVVKGKEFDEIYDLLGMRVIVENEKDCWATLGAIHSMWSPLSGRFKDYINTPKFNLYQSLHTTVVGNQGKPLEVQIRTFEMHHRAEYGIASHWGYKENGNEKVSSSDIAWVQRIVDIQSVTNDPSEFLEALKFDLEQDEVYVFTPKGKVISLPADSNAIDFAYAIHTEVGHRCVGSKINGRLVPLDTTLASGDTVEILTSKMPSAGPSQDWLKIVSTSRARNRIKQWFSRERRDDAIESGKEDLLKAMRKEGLPVQKLVHSPAMTQVMQTFNFSEPSALYAAIGEGHLSAGSVIQRLVKEITPIEEETSIGVSTYPTRHLKKTAGVYVEGLDDVKISLARCCTPVPGDSIVGFVTIGRGVSVHRSDCSNVVSLSKGKIERVIDVEWDQAQNGVFIASIEVKALDRSHLLADVAKILSEYHLNIVSSSTQSSSDRVSRMRFDFELADPAHLDSLLSSLKRIDSVYDAFRVLPGGGRYK